MTKPADTASASAGSCEPGSIHIRRVDYKASDDQRTLLDLLDAYARTPEGGGEGLNAQAKTVLCDRLSEINGAFSLLATNQEGIALGLLNALPGFSTFKAQALINVHDVYVRPDARGQGIARLLLAETIAIAKARGCCKVTLEVLGNNAAAQKSYLRAGFRPYELDADYGKAEFWQYVITD